MQLVHRKVDWSAVLSGPYCSDVPLLTSPAYTERQTVVAQVTLHQRTPMTENEVEYVEMVVLLILRRRLHASVWCVPDPLAPALATFQLSHKPRDEEKVSALNKGNPCDGIRCEYALMDQRGGGPTIPPAGTPLHFFFDENAILLVDMSNKEAAEKCQVVFALQSNYTEAIVSEKQPYKLVLTCQAPSFVLDVPVVLRERLTCMKVARAIHALSKIWREKAFNLIDELLLAPPPVAVK